MLRAALQSSGVDAEVSSAVVTVPAGFTWPQREATRKAGRMAGLADVRLLEEPIAVAMAHGPDSTPGRYSCVYDFGGGTFDLCVLERRGDQMFVVVHGGDMFLGGDDLDVAFASVVLGKLLREHNWDLTSDPESLHRLILECEVAKRRLSIIDRAIIRLSEVDPDSPVAHVALDVTRAELEGAVMNLVRRTFVTCDEVLRQANLTSRDMSAVFLAGGTTLLPLVHKMANAYFGLESNHAVSALDAIAVGASVASATGVPLG